MLAKGEVRCRLAYIITGSWLNRLLCVSTLLQVTYYVSLWKLLEIVAHHMNIVQGKKKIIAHNHILEAIFIHWGWHIKSFSLARLLKFCILQNRSFTI